ncbi:MAG: hypothetical protein AMXMBFR77_26990 [Phycisphaerales bacterium]
MTTTNAPATMSDKQLRHAIGDQIKLRPETTEEKLLADLYHRTWGALANFRRANALVEQHRERITRHTAELNCHVDRIIDAGWVTNAVRDLEQAIVGRNVAHTEAAQGLFLLHEIGLLPELRIPDYTA